MEKLIGRIIDRIYINGEFIKFKTNLGDVCYSVSGDCCSSSYLHDFTGVHRLLMGNPVSSIEQVPTSEGDTCKFNCKNCEDSDVLLVYGYRLITKDRNFGEVSSVLSFRNDSNGYYGGSLDLVTDIPKGTKMTNIISDWQYNI